MAFAITRTERLDRRNDRLPPDLAAVNEPGEAFALTVEDIAQPCFVLVCDDRAGVAWGGNATWIDIREGETAEDAARIVLTDAEETERRA
jgi:hypothetical protein